MIEFEEFDESLSKSSSPDLTPLIDMVFLLLIFFLLTSFLVRPSIQVTLPETETAQVHEDPGISITIKKNESLLLNGVPVTEDDLLESLSLMYDASEQNSVIIQSDKEVRFGRVIEIMNISREAGADNISFLVEQKK
jgi:biopolymer transport protein ExbD